MGLETVIDGDQTATRRQLEDLLILTTMELGPWVAERLGDWPAGEGDARRPSDLTYLLDVMRQHRLSTFSDLTQHVWASVYRLRELRNRWAHFDAIDDAAVAQGHDDAAVVLGHIGAGSAIVPASAPAQPPAASGHRRARSAAFCADLRVKAKTASTIAPVNRLVDDLIAEAGGRWMPYVAPYHGGIEAEVLILFQDPGRKTNQAYGGSGFIGCENDDPSAETLALCLDDAGADPIQVTPWNAYPWFLPEQGRITAAQLTEGLETLGRLLPLLPDVHTAITFGKVAHASWERFDARHHNEGRRLRHLRTFHTSGRGITNGGQQTKVEGMKHVTATLREALQR